MNPDNSARVARIAWDTWRAERAGGDAIARRQQARLADLVGYARKASPYYRRRYQGLPAQVTDPLVLPPVGKRDLMEHFDEWVTDPDVTLGGLKRDFLANLSLVGSPYLGRYHVFTTSGITGEPAVVVHDSDSWAVANVVARLRARRTLVRRGELLRHGLRSAALFAAGGHFGGVVLAESARRRSSFMARRVRVFSVLMPLSDLVRELNEFQPTMLNGYPSAIALLAGEQKAGRLRIGPFLAMTSGENLTPTAREEIGSAVGCRIIEGYAASEVPGLAVQCADGAFHVNTDWYLFEPVDEDCRPVPPGRVSHTVLVTNLANRVQPVIRYDLGDCVEVAAAPCACGSPLPAVKVEGRTNDVLSFETVDGRLVRVLPLVLRITLAYPRRDGRSEDPFLQRKWGGWDEGLSAQEVYDAGRGWWKVGARAKEERYAALTALGTVRQVIEITEWKYSEETDRSAFRGNILGPGDEMYDRYIGKPLPATSRNPIGYVDEGPEPCKCGCGEPTRNTWRPGHDQRAIHDRIRQDFGGDVAAFIDWYDNQRAS